MVCKMVKKGVLGALLGAGVLALLFGTAAPRYVKTAFHKVRHSADDSVPIQFKIDAARQEVVDLEPAIHKNIEAIYKAEVDIEELDRELATMNDKKKGEELAIKALRNHLSDGVQLTGNTSYTPEEVKTELARRFDHYREIKRIVSQKEETLKLRKQALTSAHKQLDQMRASKQALMTKIEGIETRLKQIEAAQAANEFTFDDSALARAKQTVAELSKRVEVMARVAEHEGRYADGGLALPVDMTRDIVREVDSEFGGAAKTTTADKDL